MVTSPAAGPSRERSPVAVPVLLGGAIGGTGFRSVALLVLGFLGRVGAIARGVRGFRVRRPAGASGSV